MDFSKKELQKLIGELYNADEINAADIPDIGLYMEQVTGLIDSKLGSLTRSPEDKVLTKTMINNYTKAGLLIPPVNKKYYRDHAILMILIYYLKNVLSINDIRTLFAPILNDITTREDDIIPLTEIYSAFLELKNHELDCFYTEVIEKHKLIHEKTGKLEKQNKEVAEMFLTVIMLVAQANAQKRLAEKIIDSFFKPLADQRK